MKTFLAALSMSLLGLLSFAGIASAECQKGPALSQFSAKSIQINKQGLKYPNRALPARDVRYLLYESWTLLGAGMDLAEVRARQNLRQVNMETGRVPGAEGGWGAVGLFQMIPSTFERIRICGHANSRKNPIANVLAVVNAQRKGWTKPGILKGDSGWSLNRRAPN